MRPKARLILIPAILLLSMAAAYAARFTDAEKKKLSPELRLVLQEPKNRLQKMSQCFELFDMPSSTEYNVLFKCTGSAEGISAPGVHVYTTIGSIGSARVTEEGIKALASNPQVEYIEASVFMELKLDESRPYIGADDAYSDYPQYRGKGVLVGVFDSGIDWEHEDFIDARGNTRILYLLDMTDDQGPNPQGLDYGSEYTGSDINAALDAGSSSAVREKDTNGHGTHVAGIAAGNGRATGYGVDAKTYIGVAPLADLIIVKGGDSGFSTTDQINGLSYMIDKARALGRPIAMNFSLGGHMGAHDGTSMVEMAIDEAMGEPGVCTVVAAGNEGDENIVAKDLLNSNDTYDILEVEVPEGDDYFWVDIWHDNEDEVQVYVTSPSEYESNTVTSGSSEDWLSTDSYDGRMRITAPGPNYYNNDYRILLYIDDGGSSSLEPGTWKVHIKRVSNTGFNYYAWTSAEFTTHLSDRHHVSMPGTSYEAITVGAYVTKTEWTDFTGGSYRIPNDDYAVPYCAPFSSPGPTRNYEPKPDISAPGCYIAAALSQDAAATEGLVMPDGRHILKMGTSMSAPHVTGCAALLFERNPNLTSQDIKWLFIDNATVDQYSGSVWNDNWGWGGVHVKRALDEMPGTQRGRKANHDTGNLVCSVSDWGMVADPMEFNGDDQSFGGTLVFGQSQWDMAESYGNRTMYEDDLWRTSETGRLRRMSPGSCADLEGFGQFEKYIISSTGLCRVTAKMHSYAWYGDDFVILDYDIRNAGDNVLYNAYRGFYIDYDVGSDSKNNKSGHDTQRNMAYIYEEGSSGPYMGCVMLGPEPRSVIAVDNQDYIHDIGDLYDPWYMYYMKQETWYTNRDASDLSILMSAPPVTVGSGGAAHMAVALVAGNSLTQLKQNADKAQNTYNTMGRSVTDVYYDDGGDEGGVMWNTTGNEYAVQFTPPSYPATVMTANYYVRDAGADLLVHVYDDDGYRGKPGTELLSTALRVTPEADSWNSVDLSDCSICVTGGDVYIGFEWVSSGKPVLGYDEENENAHRSWYKSGSTWKQFTDAGDDWTDRSIMIGAGFDCYTSVDDQGNTVPEEFAVTPGYPNPFNQSTCFTCRLPAQARVSVVVYDILGRHVRTVCDMDMQPGTRRVSWDGHNDAGLPVTSGVYVAVIRAGDVTANRKIVLVR